MAAREEVAVDPFWVLLLVIILVSLWIIYATRPGKRDKSEGTAAAEQDGEPAEPPASIAANVEPEPMAGPPPSTEAVPPRPHVPVSAPEPRAPRPSATSATRPVHRKHIARCRHNRPRDTYCARCRREEHERMYGDWTSD